MLLEQRQGKVCVVRTEPREGTYVLVEQTQGKVCVVRTEKRKGLCC